MSLLIPSFRRLTYTYNQDLWAKLILVLYFVSWLVPFFKSLPLTPHESFYVHFWFMLVLFSFPRLLICSEFLWCFLFIALHLFFIATARYDGFTEKYKTLLEVFYMYGFPLSVFAFLFRFFHFRFIKSLSVVILLCVVLTGITSLYALLHFPDASRALAGNDNQAEVLLLMGMNVGTYDFVYLLALISPLLLYFHFIRGGKIWLLLFLFFALVIFYAQFAAVVILFIVNVSFGLLIIFNISLKRYVFVVMFFGLSFILLDDLIVSGLSFVSSFIVNFDGVHSKFQEVILTIKGEDIAGTSLAAYNVQFHISLDAFLKSPLIGGHSGGAHHYWLDFLASYGILGFSILIFLFKNFVQRIFDVPVFTLVEKKLLLHLTLMFFCIGLNKNIVFAMPVSMFVVCPLLLIRFGAFSLLLNTKNQESFLNPRLVSYSH